MGARLTLAFTCLLYGAVPLRAAEFFYLDHDEFTHEYAGPVGPFVVSGEISAGDTQRVLAKILEDPERFLARDAVVLASRSGDVAEAIKLALLLQGLHSTVRVNPLTGDCVGVCLLIFAAADERATDGDHLLGVMPLEASPTVRGAARQLLADAGVADAFQEQLLRRSADSIDWLSVDEEAALGSRSASFTRYLAERCGWDQALERAVMTGQRPLSDLKPMLDCRRRVVLSDARRVLAGARKH